MGAVRKTARLFLWLAGAVAVPIVALLALHAAPNAPSHLAGSGGCTISWSGGAGDWSSNNWSANHPPMPSDDVCIQATGTYTVTVSGTPSVHSLTVGATTSGTVQTLAVETPGCGGNATFTAATDINILSPGVISLTTVGGSCAQTVNLAWGGTLTNAGTLSTDQGSVGGGRTLQGNLTNSGSLDINYAASFSGSASTLTNNGVVNLVGALTLPGTGANAQTMVNGAGGSITGTGNAIITGGSTFNQAAGASGNQLVVIQSSKLVYSGAGGGTILMQFTGNTLSGNLSAGQNLVMQAIGCAGNTDATAAASFTNAGSIDLTSITGSCAQANTLTWSGILTNTGTIATDVGTVGGGRFLNGNLTNSGGSVDINTNTSYSAASTTFTNGGVLNLATGATLTLPNSQTLLNAGGGTITGTGLAAVTGGGTFNQGAGDSGSQLVLVSASSLVYSGSGPGTLLEQGTSTLSGSLSTGQNLLIESVGCSSTVAVTAAASFSNAGTITLTNVNGSCAQSDTLSWTGTLTSSGTITTLFGQNGGTRTLQGNLTNSAGTLAIDTNTSYSGANTTLKNNGTISLGSGATLTLPSTQTLLDGLNGSITGSGSVLIDNGGTFNQGAGNSGNSLVVVLSSNLVYSGAGPGTLDEQGTSTLAGSLSAGQNLVLESVGCVSNAAISASASFTNGGSIDLTNVSGTCAQSVGFTWTGTLSNTGTLATDVGTNGGARTLTGTLSSTGTVNINANTTFNGTAAHFSNNGALVVAASFTFTLPSGQTLANGPGGSITGPGIVGVTSSTFVQGAGNSGTGVVSLISSALTYTGSGPGAILDTGNGTLTGNLSAGQVLTIESVGCQYNVVIVAAASFSNAGSIELTNVLGTCAQSASLSWTGTLTNTGTITSDAGLNGGARNLTGSLANAGTLTITTNTSFDGSSATLTNTAAVAVAGGATLTLPSGQTISNNAGGTLTGPGVIGVNGGTVNQGAGNSGVGVLSLLSSNLAYTGSGAGTVLDTGNGGLSGNISAGQTLTIESVGCQDNVAITAAASFTNAGVIHLTNVLGTCGQTSTLAWSGTLTDTGTIISDAGTNGGARNLQGNLTVNAPGLLDIATPTGFDGSSTTLNNASGTVEVDAGGSLVLGSNTYADTHSSTFSVGVTPTTNGILTTSSPLAVAGGLAVTTSSPPAAGTRYTIISDSAQTGSFSRVNSNGQAYTVTYEPVGAPTSVVLTAGTNPTSSSLSPSAVGQGAVQKPLILTGTGFQAGAQATVSGTGVTVKSTTVNSATQATIVVTVSPTAPTGPRTLTLTNPDGGGTSQTLTIDAAPVVSGIAPSALGQGATNQPVTITGSGFVSPATLSIGTGGITVSNVVVVSATKITADVSVGPAAPAGAADVRVTNPDSGVGVCSGCFHVDAAPHVTGASPNALGQGAVSQTVTITGSGFQSPASVSFGRTGFGVKNVVVVSSTQITATVSVASDAPAGLHNVTVTNGDQGVGTCSGCFTVDTGPTVASATPNTVAPGATNVNVVIAGSHFAAGATVTISGNGRVHINSVTVNGPTQITINITVASNALAGPRTITVINPDAGQGSCSTCFSVS